MKTHTSVITMVKRSLAPLTLILAFSLTLSACGGFKKDKPALAESKQPSVDITRPPETIVGRKEVEERDPEETISFDEWRKRRLEEQKEQASPE
ncbi:hypothetical protein NBRC116583_38240 [Arenicella sp. 4NH20-0111]|uniref:hypothetical protein n=1 Tax=Arenicella sp. 4NH20-0111 TaxID=3127648 RepID=UPI00310AE50B